MKTKEEILKPKILSYLESHQFENALTEEGEYIKLKDAMDAMEEFLRQNLTHFVAFLLDTYDVEIDKRAIDNYLNN